MADFEVREATAADIPLLARHRSAMFRDMGSLAAASEKELTDATAEFLRHALSPRGGCAEWARR